MFDGPILMVAASAPDRLTVYHATYSWHTADRADPLPATAGALGVQLAVVGDEGTILWQRRTETVDHPGGWTISVAGPRCPESDSSGRRRRGGGGARAGCDDLEGLAPLALVESARGRTVQVVFRARLRAGAVPALRESEVAEVRFARDLPSWAPSRR